MTMIAGVSNMMTNQQIFDWYHPPHEGKPPRVLEDTELLAVSAKLQEDQKNYLIAVQKGRQKMTKQLSGNSGQYGKMAATPAYKAWLLVDNEDSAAKRYLGVRNHELWKLVRATPEYKAWLEEQDD